MNKSLVILAVMAAVSAGASAQSLNVSSNGITYSYAAENTGLMTFTGGETVTIGQRVYNLAEVAVMKVGDEAAADNTVTIEYKEDAVDVTVAGNIASYVDITLNGAEVSIAQSDEVADDTCGEITYILKGESSHGNFKLSGSYKSSIELHGLFLTSTNGAAIDIQNGKRTALRVQEGTVNTLSDAAGGSQKAALYCKGHLEFKQKGSLTVTGNTGHAISAKEYIEIKNTTINVTGAVKDGINCNQYLLVESGNINISGTGDDAIQVAFKDDADREAEDTGTITIKGGTLILDVTAPAAKALKADGDFVMTKGTVNATVSGIGTWDSTNKKTKAAACISADGNLDISGGTFNLTATGGGGKGISVNGNLNISGGEFTIYTNGGRLAYVNGTLNQNYTGNADNLNSDYKSSPKGIKVDGDIVIDGGEFDIWTKGGGGEGMESKKTITINDGKISIRAYEDGTNSSSHTYIKGGELTVTTGTGDAVDANGNIYVEGGRVTIIGAASPEQGFDAGDGFAIYITGGTILAGGGGNSAPSNSASTQAYVILTQTLTAGAAVAVLDGETELASFTIPAAYSSASASAPVMRGPGGGNWGWGGGSGNSLLISTPDMVNGRTYTVKVGNTSTTATARLTGGSTGPGH